MSLFGALNICEEVLKSKKYTSLHRPLVLRICEEEYKKYNNDKERLKAAKNTLHTMFGAYMPVDSYKKAWKLLDAGDTDQILNLHASTKERLQDLSEFYRFIFDSIGPIDSVLDIGCGFNPFTLSYFPQKPTKYHALDIDGRIADINNRFFDSIGMPELAGCSDIVAGTPTITADVAFLFKILPLIERQSKGRSAKLLREIDSQFLIITYPTKSLSGKEKGMQEFYAAAFEEVMGGNLFVFAKRQIGMELVYVVAKK